MTTELMVIAAVCAGAALVMLLISVVRISRFADRFSGVEKGQERTERTIREVIAENRTEATREAKGMREEVSSSFAALNRGIVEQIMNMAGVQQNQLTAFSGQLQKLTEANERRLDSLRSTVERKLGEIQEDNGKRLEKMRETVDEKLHATLERRLGESFRLVEEKLASVQKGLGEMQALASDVGDLKKVLSNVKSRGIWGELSLKALLEDVLTPEQYGENVAVRPRSSERVEFAIRLPGLDDGAVVWLPVDAKFPKEDYERLLAAQESGDAASIGEAGKSLETQVKLMAKTIKEKYIEPPYTTDFALMYLPIEGLYAEALRRPGLIESLQREYRVSVAGPTTLCALLNSLRVGFRTLAIQKRSSEVWALLSGVKKEFGTFGDLLEKTKTKIDEAGNTLETAVKKTRTIERKLDRVEELPGHETLSLVAEPEAAGAAGG